MQEALVGTALALNVPVSQMMCSPKPLPVLCQLKVTVLSTRMHAQT